MSVCRKFNIPPPAEHLENETYSGPGSAQFEGFSSDRFYQEQEEYFNNLNEMSVKTLINISLIAL